MFAQVSPHRTSMGTVMLRYIFADQLHRYPDLRDSMFQDRADQFRTRLGWEVSVTSSGEERDSYDDENPLYVIWENEQGLHGGSMRFLPTTGPVMVNDHFGELTTGPIVSSLIFLKLRVWEKKNEYMNEFE